jgi:hypothetical protein
MNRLSEFDKLYKVKEQKAQKSLEVNLQIELHHMKKRKEILKAESELQLDRCVNWQNGMIFF